MKIKIVKLLINFICWLSIDKKEVYKWGIYHEFKNGNGAGNRPVNTQELVEWLLLKDKNYSREWYEISSYNKPKQ